MITIAKYTPAQAEAIKRYREKSNYVEVHCRVSKEKRAIIKAHAEQQAESTNAFINRAIDETIQRDNEKAHI